MSHWLFDEQGKQYLQAEYERARRSTHQIADEQKTYPNLVRRALIKHGIKLRDKSEAQKNALSRGSHPHPTKGRKRTEEERNAIREGMKKDEPN